jgi:signal transduction histidine kinase
MAPEKNQKRELRRLTLIFGLIAIGVAIIIIVSLVMSQERILNNTREVLRIQALSSFEKDVAYRRWNSNLGGIYSWITETLLPNPYLSVEERDLELNDGRKLTLVNPAYMTRLVHEIQNQSSGVRGHITSLKPLRPQNKPDGWEIKALRSFEDGEEEFHSYETIEGKGYYRFMKPLLVEESCLKCHAIQGYKVNEIRGGISVAVPVKRFHTIRDNDLSNCLSMHSFFLVASFAGISAAYYSFRKRLVQKHEMERQLVEANSKLQESNRELEAFSYTVAHDLRNPLRHMRGFSDLLSNTSEDETSQQILGKINDSAERMDQLIADLLNYAKVQEQELVKEDCDLAQMANEIVDRLRQADSSRRIKFDVPDTLPAGCDRKLAEIVLENLLGNAWKYTSKEKYAIIEMGIQEDSVFYIRDNGAGFDSKLSERLFEPFYRLHPKSEFPGTGVGLATVYRIIEKHGGSIRASGSLGVGAVFYFSFEKKNV